MKTNAIFLALCLGSVVISAVGKGPRAASTDQIKQAIIRESIASYPGNCACPYQSTRNGRACGRRSAYSRAGGYSVLCYPADVTEDMVKAYLRQQ